MPYTLYLPPTLRECRASQNISILVHPLPEIILTYTHFAISTEIFLYGP